jgi:hypothetical protein
MSFYGTVADADAYHTARGNAAWGIASTEDKEAALTTASDYVDSFKASFPGKKTAGRAQDREWPRIGSDGDPVVDATGEEIATDEVPGEVESATYEGALLVLGGTSLTLVTSTSSTAGAIVRKRVKAGPVETETQYSTETGVSNEIPWFQKISSLLENILTGGRGGATVGLLRV